MTRFPWGTMAPIPYADAKYNVTVNMRANGMIETEGLLGRIRHKGHDQFHHMR